LPQLRAGTNDPRLLRLTTDHEALHVLEKHERQRGLVAFHHKASPLLGRVRVEDAADLQLARRRFAASALVGHDPDGAATDLGVGRHQRRPVVGAKLLHRTGIDHARQDVADVELGPLVTGDDAVDFLRIAGGD
jgi:hypothetical protein